MTRTLQCLLEEAGTTLDDGGLAQLDWMAADIVAARRTHGGTVVGELGWPGQAAVAGLILIAALLLVLGRGAV